MSTAQKLRKKISTETKNVVSLIPGAVQTKQKSAILIKQLVGATISEILFYRKIFDDSYFSTNHVDGIEIKMLKANQTDPAAKRIADITYAAHDAIDKGYLHQMIFIIKDENKVYEKHILTFQYSDETYKTCMVKYTTDTVTRGTEKKLAIDMIKDQCKCLIQTLHYFLSQSASKLKSPSITMKLTYYEDVTPSDYHPEFFEPDSTHDPIDGIKQKVGVISTPFHSFKVVTQIAKQDVDTNISQWFQMENEIKKSGHTVAEDSSQMFKTAFSSALAMEASSSFHPRVLFRQDAEVPHNSSSVPELRSPERPVSAILPGDNESTASDMTPVCCPCKGSYMLPEMIKCHHCQTYQHMPCFSIIHYIHLPDIHTCVTCAEQDPNLMCTRPQLLDVEPELRSEQCQFLRALAVCKDFSMITNSLLSEHCEISLQEADKIINKFIFLGFAVQKSKGFHINRTKYKHIVSEYFYNFAKSAKATLPTPAEIAEYNNRVNI